MRALAFALPQMRIECSRKSCPVALANGGTCGNMRLQRRAWAKHQVLPSGNKGFGLFAKAPLKQDGLVIEYVGEIISEDECRRRLEDYHVDKHRYIMALSAGEVRRLCCARCGRGSAAPARQVIDATRQACVARFMNHCCEPNCATEMWSVDGEHRVGA